jgi:hypothetical protein
MIRMLVEGFAFLAVALLTIYVVLYFVNIYKGPFQGQKAFYNLSVPNQLVLPTSDFIWTSRPCAIRFTIFIESAPRTVGIVDCIQPEESPTRFAPNCGDYQYKPCKCLGADCTACSLDNTATGYMSRLLQISDHIQLWASGYTNQNDKPYVPAMLKIRTGKDASQHYMESIPLPAIPLQKWTAITIVKEGRRFDVYYGAKLEVSKMTENVPIEPDSTLQWVAGNTRWKGQIGLFKGFSSMRTTEDVRKDMDELLNTRGIPYYTESIQFPSMPAWPKCLFGNCAALPDVKPRNPFSVYQSSLS